MSRSESVLVVAGSRWALTVGSISVSKNFAAGQMREMGRYDVPCEVSFPGFGIGMTIEDFQIAGILEELAESLNSAVRYAVALGPKCFRRKMLSLSGPKAFVLLQLLIALVTRSVVNVTVVSLGFRRTSLDTNRVSREE